MKLTFEYSQPNNGKTNTSYFSYPDFDAENFIELVANVAKAFVQPTTSWKVEVSTGEGTVQNS